jgi:5-methylcytosine-specific restriction endonuclease McrA
MLFHMVTRREWSKRKNRQSLSDRLGRTARLIRERDGHACVYCGATEASSGARLHLDHLIHLIPRAAGGLNAATNLVTACASCNCARQKKPLAQWCSEIGVDEDTIWAQARKELPEG